MTIISDQIIQAIYGTVALLGIFVYSYLGYRAKNKQTGEAFDASKFLDSILTSGTMSTVVAVIGFSSMGLTFPGLLAAFLTGAGIDTSLNKTLKTVKTKKPV